MKNSRIFVIVLLALVCVAIATLADPSRRQARNKPVLRKISKYNK